MAKEIEGITVGTTVNGLGIALQHLPAGTIELTDVYILMIGDTGEDISKETYEFIRQRVQSPALNEEDDDDSTGT